MQKEALSFFGKNMLSKVNKEQTLPPGSKCEKHLSVHHQVLEDVHANAYFFDGGFKMTRLKNYFSKLEIVLWSASVTAIIISFCVFDRVNYLTLSASLIGVTSLIFNAKGSPAVL